MFGIGFPKRSISVNQLLLILLLLHDLLVSFIVLLISLEEI